MSSSRTAHPAIESIKAILAERGLGTSEFARRLGWGRMRLHRRLDGTAPLTVAELEEIADALDVQTADLLGDNA